ncbi:MAG: hypothetical protein ACRC35_00285 [Angustibacter sp.]
MSEPGDGSHRPRVPWDNPNASSREEILRRARPLPPAEESVIEDLTEDEERRFWTAITSA